MYDPDQDVQGDINKSKNGKLNTFEDSQLLARIYRITQTELNLFEDIYNEQEDGYNYLAGDQYKNEVKEWWETQLRPTRAVNILFPVFNRVLGDFLINDDPIRAFADVGGDPRTANMIEKLIDHMNSPNENDAKTLLGQWALSGLIRAGFVYPRWSNERRLDGSVVIGNVDEFEVLYDHRARDYFLDDARYMIRTRWMDADEIYHWWPQHKTELSSLIIDYLKMGIWDGLTEAETSMIMDGNFINEKDGKYRIVEFHEIVYEKGDVAYDPRTGEVEPFALEGKKADVYRRLNPEKRIITRNNIKIKKITNVIPGLAFILDKPYNADIQDGTFDIIKFSPYNYARYSINHFGLFRNSKEVQDSFNEWRNEAESAAKMEADPQKIGDKAKIENWKDLENFSRMPGLHVWAKDNAPLDQTLRLLDERANRNQGSGKAMEMMALDSEFLQKVTGVTANLEGVSENAQENASLYAQKVRQAKVALETMYHNYSKSKTRMYNKAVRIAQDNIDTERYFLINVPNKITGQMEQQEFGFNIQQGNNILYNLGVGRYQVYISTQEHNPSARALRFLQKRDVAQLLAQWYGPASVPPEWLLGESDLGDIDVVIQRIYQVLQAQATQAQQDEAIGVTGALQDMAAKNLQLQSSPETSKPQAAGTPANK